MALTYNDQSVLENMHAATAFRLMQEFGLYSIVHYFNWPEITEQMTPDEGAVFRKLIISMILATDMRSTRIRVSN